MKIPRPVLIAGLTALVVAALVAIAVSGPESPRQAGVAPVASLPPVPLPADGPTATPSASRSPSRSPVPPSRSPSKRPTASPSPTPTTALSYEAEAPGNLLGSGARVAPMDGASGAAGVYGIGGRNLGTLTFTGVTVPSFGIYQLTIYYQNPDPGTTRTGVITVNDIPNTRDFPTTGGCCTATRTLPVTLRAGPNTVTVSNPYGPGPDIDRIVIAA